MAKYYHHAVRGNTDALKFNTETPKKIDMFIELCKAGEETPSLLNLAIFLSVSRSTLIDNWPKNKHVLDMCPDYCDKLCFIDNLGEADITDGGLTGRYKERMSIHLLKAVYGHEDNIGLYDKDHAERLLDKYQSIGNKELLNRAAELVKLKKILDDKTKDDDVPSVKEEGKA